MATETVPPGTYYVERWPRSRFWAIFAPGGDLVALVVYRKGAAALLARLNGGQS